MDLFTILFGGGFVLGGLVCILVAIIQRANAKVAESWPTAPGQIISSGLQAISSYSSSSSTHSTTNYAPTVQYNYTIMGHTYTGYQLAFGNVQYDYRTAARKLAPYPQGAQVIVHYDPSDLTNAVLETKAAGSGIFYAIGIVFLIVGILAFIFLPTLQQYAS
jgi:hypothetical protein